jgi:hypothetical protein
MDSVFSDMLGVVVTVHTWAVGRDNQAKKDFSRSSPGEQNCVALVASCVRRQELMCAPYSTFIPSPGKKSPCYLNNYSNHKILWD